ncbi:hypothetical protein SAMN02787099_00267 [Lysinibacillus fusiformis]|nr:hypothetical protein SAMN02787099_00267 [Lysinibacillus fusiformis]
MKGQNNQAFKDTSTQNKSVEKHDATKEDRVQPEKTENNHQKIKYIQKKDETTGKHTGPKLSQAKKKRITSTRTT